MTTTGICTSTRAFGARGMSRNVLYRLALHIWSTERELYRLMMNENEDNFAQD